MDPVASTPLLLWSWDPLLLALIWHIWAMQSVPYNLFLFSVYGYSISSKSVLKLHHIFPVCRGKISLFQCDYNLPAGKLH